jgi:hypothetical protein
LTGLLVLDRVLMHPLIVGEIACATPPQRARTLTDLNGLKPAQQASIREVIGFIERERLFGLGCGLIDLTLLASTLVTPQAQLWTLDQRLGALATRFGVMYGAPPH